MMDAGLEGAAADAARNTPRAAWVRTRVAGEFLRYFMASAAALALDFGLLVLLVEHAGWPLQAAAATGFLAGTVLTYVLSLSWIFQERAFSHWYHGLWKFALIGLLGLGLNALLLHLLANRLGLDYRFAKLSATGVSFLFNFSVRRLLLFTRAIQTGGRHE